MEDFKPADLHIIRDLEAAKAIADPLRLQIIEVLLHCPLTVNTIASKLGVAASRLYYHVNTLEKHGLIRVVDTTTHGNLIEKHYWVTAYDYSLDHEIFNFNVQEAEGKDNIISMALNSLDLVREDFSRSIEARAYNLEQGAEPYPRRVIQSREVCRVPEDKIESFQSRLKDLMKEFEDLDDPDNPGNQPWAFTIFLYPTFYFESPETIVGATDE
jgi:DNA-binding transcriptional ArsR family regulator